MAHRGVEEGQHSSCQVLNVLLWTKVLREGEGGLHY